MPADRLLHPRAGHSEKVTSLSDLEYRVWTQYLLSADDFGVMRASAVTLQADNDSLAAKSQKVVARALESIIAVRLVDVFDHQKRRYVFQLDWQTWQKVEYPRATNEPMPPADAVAKCDEATRRLFSVHPGGKSQRTPKKLPNESQIASEDLPVTHAGVPAKRLTANGNRQVAYLEESPRETKPSDPPRMDEWARELVNLYPAQGRCGWNLVERPLWEVISAMEPLTALEAWSSLRDGLEAHKRSHQWRAKGMIPRLDKWLREGLYLQQLPEAAPIAEQVTGKTGRMLSAVANIMREGGA